MRPKSYEKLLGNYLRVQRGERTFRAFARKIGVSHATLQRLEMGDQNVTLKTLRLITRRLKVKLNDIFPDA